MKKIIFACVVLTIAIIVPMVIAAGLSAHIGIQLSITQSEQDSFSKLNFSTTRGVSFTDGALANQADTLWQDSRTLADAASETLDFQDGTLTDSFGNAVTMDIVKAIYIKNNSSDATLLIGAAAGNQLGLFSDGASDKLKLPPDGEFLFICPDLTGLDTTTNADLKLEHDGTGSSTLTYDIIVVGVG